MKKIILIAHGLLPLLPAGNGDLSDVVDDFRTGFILTDGRHFGDLRGLEGGVVVHLAVWLTAGDMFARCFLNLLLYWLGGTFTATG